MMPYGARGRACPSEPPPPKAWHPPHPRAPVPREAETLLGASRPWAPRGSQKTMLAMSSPLAPTRVSLH